MIALLSLWLSIPFSSPADAVGRGGSVALFARISPNGELLTLRQGDAGTPSSASAMGNMFAPNGTQADLFVCGTFQTSFRLGNRTVSNPEMTDIFTGWIGALPELSATVSELKFVISWPALPDRVSYSVEYTAEPGATGWTPVSSGVYLKQGQQFVTNEISGGPCFYRVVVTPQ